MKIIEVEKTITLLEDFKNDEDVDGYPMHTMSEKLRINKCIEIINKQPTVERPKWIPVSERLPEKNMPCLVSVGKLNLIHIATYSDIMQRLDHKIFYVGDYGCTNFTNITEYVNAWMPLPEPYKTEEESEE